MMNQSSSKRFQYRKQGTRRETMKNNDLNQIMFHEMFILVLNYMLVPGSSGITISSGKHGITGSGTAYA